MIGTVTGKTITHSGSGNLSIPKGLTQAPDELLTAAPTATLKLDTNLVTFQFTGASGFQDQLQNSTELATWSHMGKPFGTAESVITRHLEPTAGAAFYRLIDAP